jgi:hypothetical protein
MTGAGVRRVFLVLGVVMATGMAAGAMAQTTGGQATGGQATGGQTTGAPVVTHENKIKGTARSAIPGPPPRAPARLNGMDKGPMGANVPTLPQIALHPTWTLGSGTPMAGPGGNTKSVVGN